MFGGYSWKRPDWDADTQRVWPPVCDVRRGPIVGALRLADPFGQDDVLMLSHGEAICLLDALVSAYPDRDMRPLAVRRLVLALGHAEELATVPGETYEEAGSDGD